MPPILANWSVPYVLVLTARLHLANDDARTSSAIITRDRKSIMRMS